MGDHISMIVSGSSKIKDWKYMNKHLNEKCKGMDVKLEYN